MKIRLRPMSTTAKCLLSLFFLCILSPTCCEDGSGTQTVASTDHPRNPTANDTGKVKTVTDEGGGIALNEVKTSSDVVQSSFEEVPGPEGNSSPQQDYLFVDVVSQNAGIINGIGDETSGVVITLVDTATVELQQRAELSSQNEEHETFESNLTDVVTKTVVVAKNLSDFAENGSSDGVLKVEKLDVPKAEAKENLTEEIPSFSEWAQKQLEEAEKKREEGNTSSQNQHWNGKPTNNLKVRSKNYASPDCGAKIVAANPEAVSPSSVLSPSRDEYKLNTCTSRVWFIVELCEAIQAKRIDLANFELFSSSPKDFSVSVSDRYPSREWSNVGHFTAKDERDVQTFDLSPHLFGKYIKVEMHSHHGSEHFCPISLFRVYGTSEFEVLEKEDRAQTDGQDDDDDDETLDSEKGQSPKNLFSSATDAVISIVKKAAEVLGNKGNASNQTSVEDSLNVIKYTPLVTTCTTPSHIVVCNNCSDILFGKVFELLSCRSRQINNLLSIDLISRTIYNTAVCLQFGLDFRSKRITDIPNIYSSYVKSFFLPQYLAALCNTVAVIENKVVFNVSDRANTTIKDTFKDTDTTEATEVVITDVVSPLKTDDLESTEPIVVNKIDVSTIHEGIVDDISYISQIKPTKTLMPEELIEITRYVSQQENSATEVVKPTQTLREIGESVKSEEDAAESSGVNVTELETNTESVEAIDLENLISDFNIENTTASAAPPPHIKESVFLRLSNRIKTLERNMSLSSQYLEELSRRYKKQVEELQRLLEKTVTALNEEGKRKEERNDRLEEKIARLTEIVEALVAERNNSFNPLHWLALIVISMLGIFTFCRRSERKFPSGTRSVAEIQRRKSIDVINRNAPAKKERRPSEEALKITGTYEHLLVDDTDVKKKSRERKRKKKKHLLRSNSITTLSEEQTSPRSTWSDTPAVGPSKAYYRQESTPAIVQWNGGNGIEDVPFVLEESDNSHLQDMPLPKPLQPNDPPTLSPDSSNVSSSNGDVPFRKVSSPAFLRSTATETRKLRKFTSNSGITDTWGHKKSASVDETKFRNSPAPSAGNVGLDGTSDGPKNGALKKEKRGTFKKIFKKVF